MMMRRWYWVGERQCDDERAVLSLYNQLFRVYRGLTLHHRKTRHKLELSITSYKVSRCRLG